MGRRRVDGLLLAALAAVSYVPLFLSQPGRIAADTKQYLYLDPTRLTAGAASMWDPNTGMGTVTHQNIGYLLPMGPYYSLVQWLGVPMWVGQRIWMGTLILAAGAGVAYCARRLGLEGPGRVVAAFAYALSPYILDYLDRTSAILMPWAALGWMIGLAAAAARSGRWRQPALFAIVVALVGGVNATSILLVLLAPVVWLAHAASVTREITWRRAAATAVRLGILTLLVSVWWAAGLWAEGRYGINVLRVTETIPTVARTSSPAEVLRGLGYWYFYGWDKVQPWTLQAPPYTQDPWLIVVSFAVPGVGLLLGCITRWAYRSFCLALIGVATVVAVGAFPYTEPSIFGNVIKGASAGSTVALAMRSVDRIVPLVVLGVALLMGSGATALGKRLPLIGVVAATACVGLVAADLPAMWDGGIIASNLTRPSKLPAYWEQAARYLNDSSTYRVLGLPGEDFGAYSFGVTMDPVPPGLLTRSYVNREVVPSGTPASADLVQALDEPLQEGTLDADAIAPVARLMGANQVLVQSDLQYERYHLPLPQVLQGELEPTPAGLTGPVKFGAPDPAPTIRYPLLSEARLGLPTGDPQPPALEVYGVAGARPLLRAESTSAPLVVAGDGSGLVEAASAGLLDGRQPILYAASLAAQHRPVPAGSTLVVTDTNALAQHRWGSLRDNVGEVQTPGAPDLTYSPSDYNLPVFPAQTTADQTVSQLTGARWVTASQYGDSLSFTPENRPVNAFDGDPSTAWTFGAHEAAGGIRVEIELDHPVTANHVTLEQVNQLGAVKRRITAVTLLFDGGQKVTVPVTKASLASQGQVVRFPARTFNDFTLVVDGATGGADKKYDGLPAVGFREISIPGVPAVRETLRLPTDAISESSGHPLDILLQRSRAVEPPRHDPEPYMSRTFVLPSPRAFSVSGTAEVDSGDSDYLIDQLVGLTPDGPLPPPAAAGTPLTVVVANSSTRLDGDRQARANAAADGNPGTAWIAETGPQAGEWLSLTLNRATTLDHLNLEVVDDGRHSLPTKVTVSTASGSRTVSLPPLPAGNGRPQGATATVHLEFPAITGRTVRLTIDSVHQVRALDYYSTFAGLADILPVAIAEVGIPGVMQPQPPAQVPGVCTAGLLKVDGRPVDVEVTGSTVDALAGRPLQVELCGASKSGLRLGAGPHVVQTSPRLPTGWAIDSLQFSSPGPAVAAAVPPAVSFRQTGRTSLTADVTASGSPAWLVLGESYSTGWRATASGRSLGPPQLVDGFANGWLLPAMPPGHRLRVELSWTPQRVVWVAIAVSAAALILCAVLACFPTVPRRREDDREDGMPPEPASWRAAAGWPAQAAGGLSKRRALGAVAVCAVWGVLVAASSRPWLGVAAAAAAAAGLFGRQWVPGRTACRVGALACLIALPVYVASQQEHHRYWPDIEWPANLSGAGGLAWLALALLGSDVVAGGLRRVLRDRTVPPEQSGTRTAGSRQLALAEMGRAQ